MEIQRIIAFYGQAGSGKTTLAEAICRRDDRFRRFSFATPLKETAHLWFGIPVVEQDKKEAKEKLIEGFEKEGLTLRRFLQMLGTEIGRDMVAEDIWVRLLFRRVLLAKATHIVIDDLRYENEMQAIVNRGEEEKVSIVKLVREGLGKPMGHRSEDLSWESKVESPTITILQNNGSLEELYDRASALI